MHIIRTRDEIQIETVSYLNLQTQKKTGKNILKHKMWGTEEVTQQIKQFLCKAGTGVQIPVPMQILGELGGPLVGGHRQRIPEASWLASLAPPLARISL